jgi:uncharacterized protein
LRLDQQPQHKVEVTTAVVMEMPKEGIEVLSSDECEQLLRSSSLGRLALVVNGHPEVFPVNYAFAEGVVVFRTAPGLKLERAPLTRVAFEVDRVDTAHGIAWSVVIKGTAHDITTAADRLPERLRSLAIHPQAPGARNALMAIHEDSISGRRFGLPPQGQTPWLHLP